MEGSEGEDFLMPGAMRPVDQPASSITNGPENRSV